MSLAEYVCEGLKELSINGPAERSQSQRKERDPSVFYFAKRAAANRFDIRVEI